MTICKKTDIENIVKTLPDNTSVEEVMEKLALLAGGENGHRRTDAGLMTENIETGTGLTTNTTRRQWLWNVLQGRSESGQQGQYFEIFIFTVILLNIIAVILGSIDQVQKQYGFWLDKFEFISVMIFTVEYLARLWSCVSDMRYHRSVTGRIKYSLKPMSLIDLLAILPFYLPFIGVDLRSLRVLRLMRILRIAKLGRYNHSLKIIRHVVWHNRRELIMTFSLMLVLLVFASTLLYCCENKAQPETFSSIPATMWWAITTITTVGYGDMYPITPLGKLCAGLVAILGILSFALPTGIIGAGFVQAIQEKQARRQCPHCGKELHQTDKHGN